MNLLDRILDPASSGAGAARDRARQTLDDSDRPGFGAVAVAGIAGTVIGAAVALVLDPDRGRARRARLADQAGAAIRKAVRSGEQATRRVRGTVRGRLAAMQAERTPQARPIDDATLTDRVQSIVFRDDAVPKGTLNINVERGIVVLRGEVPDGAMKAQLISEVEGIEGVWSVRDLLHLPGEPAPTTSAAT